MKGWKMNRIDFLQARIMHNEMQKEQVHDCRMLLVKTNIDVGTYHMGKARQAIGLALRDLILAVRKDQEELAFLAEDDNGT